MKKKLLFLGALMLTSIGASAQWVVPVPSKIQEMATDSTVQFLYNREAGGFFAGANDWSTRASVAVKGDSIRFIETEQSGLYNFACYPSVKNSWLYVSCNDYENQWVDATLNNTNYPGTDSWVIEKQDDGSYVITNSVITEMDEKATLGVAEYWKGVSGDTRTYFNFSEAYYDVNGENMPCLSGEWYDKWVFVSPEEADTLTSQLETYFAALELKAAIEAVSADNEAYDVKNIQAVYDNTASTLEELQATKDLCYAIIDLNKAIADAEATYSNLDFGAPKSVYANINATLDEVKAATANVQTIINDYLSSQASFDTPIDFTDVIGDGSSVDPWTQTFTGEGSVGSHSTNTWSTEANNGADGTDMTTPFVEHWVASGSILSDQKIHQVFKGAAPGLYKFTANVRAYSEGGGIEAFEGLHMYFGDTRINLQDKAPMFMSGTKCVLWSKDKFSIIAIVKETADIELGFEIDSANFNWLAFKETSLLFYGNENVEENAVKLFKAAYSFEKIGENDEVVAMPALITTYNSAVDVFEAAVSQEEIEVAAAAAQTAKTELDANINAYKAYIAKVDEVQNELANNNLDESHDSVAYLSDYFLDDSAPGEYYPNGGYEYIINELTLTTEQLLAEVENLVHWLQSAVKNGVGTGADMTNMLVNPSFADGFNGWTNSKGETPIGNVGGVAICKNVEVYQNVVDITQTVTGVPAGVYSISVQAFERPAGNGNYDGTEAANVFIYMNEFQTPVMNITADAMPEADAQDQVNCLVGDGGGAWPNDYNFNGGWVPNSMDGASYAFAVGRYVNKCYGIIGDDGVMHIGLTSNGKSIPEWILWANFKLTFEGKSDEAMAEILASTVEQAQVYMEEKSAEMTTPALNAIMDALAKAESAVDYETSYAALTELNHALAAAKENVDANAAALAAIDAMYAAFSEYEGSASEETLNKFVEISGKTEGVAEMVTADLVVLTEDVKNITYILEQDGKYAAAEDLVIEGEASETNPIDVTSFIINADFSAGADDGSWTYTKNGGNGPKYDGAFDGPGFEFWNGSATALQFDINQSLYKLPAGYYKLTAQLTNSLNGQTEGTNGGRVHLYADVYKNYVDSTYSVPVEIQSEDANTSPDTYEVVFYVDAPAYGSWVVVGARTVGTMDARWTVGDSFTLTYLGTATPTNIEAVENAEEAVPVAFYSISGAPLAAPQKGINIVKMSDGSVKKVFVK